METNLAQQDLAETAPAVREMMHRGEAILLFDGVDEVPLTKRPLIWQAIGALANGPFVDCPWIATCRKLSYNDVEAAQAGMTGQVALAQFNADQVEKFIQSWFEALQKAGGVTPDQAEGWAKRLQAAASGPLRELAGNPMLLTIMALVQTSRATLPEERVKLYLACVQTLLFRWQQHKETAEYEMPRRTGSAQTG